MQIDHFYLIHSIFNPAMCQALSKRDSDVRDIQIAILKNVQPSGKN